MLLIGRKEDGKENMISEYNVWKTIFNEEDPEEIKELVSFIIDDYETQKLISNELIKLKKVNNIKINFKNIPSNISIEEIEDDIVRKIIDIIKKDIKIS